MLTRRDKSFLQLLIDPHHRCSAISIRTIFKILTITKRSRQIFQMRTFKQIRRFESEQDYSIQHFRQKICFCKDFTLKLDCQTEWSEQAVRTVHTLFLDIPLRISSISLKSQLYNAALTIITNNESREPFLK